MRSATTTGTIGNGGGTFWQMNENGNNNENSINDTKTNDNLLTQTTELQSNIMTSSSVSTALTLPSPATFSISAIPSINPDHLTCHNAILTRLSNLVNDVKAIENNQNDFFNKNITDKHDSCNGCRELKR